MGHEAILVHGWDPNYYNTRIAPENKDPGIAWSHRPELIRLLSEKYILHYCNLPGFGGEPEPRYVRYDVEDFAHYIDEWIKRTCPNPDLFIGYSFGGAALLDKTITHDPTPTVLISPALFRSEGLRSGVANRVKDVIPEMWTDYFRHLYQLFASRYYREGTPFLKRSYNTIVRRDIRPLLRKVDSGSILLIYGESDTATPWQLVKDTVTTANLPYHIIANGEHNIGQTHPQEIVDRITNFIQNRK